MPGWIPVQEAMERLGVSLWWVRRHARADGVQITGNRLPSAAVEEWIEQARIQPGARRLNPGGAPSTRGPA